MIYLISSYVIQVQKRFGGLTNVTFKVLFGYLKSSLIGLRKQLSNVTVPHYKKTLYIRWPEPIYIRVGYVFERHFSTGKI